MTEQELQSVINVVLSSIKTNSRSIGQLTAVQSLSDSDYFEVDGGRKVAYSALRDLISAYDMDKFQETLKSVDDAIYKLQTALNTLVTGDASDAIDNFHEVITFLDGIKDNEKLSAKLVALQEAIDKKQDPATTLAGYGITDAYTKTETDSKLSALQDAISAKVGAINAGDGVTVDGTTISAKCIFHGTTGTSVPGTLASGAYFFNTSTGKLYTADSAGTVAEVSCPSDFLLYDTANSRWMYYNGSVLAAVVTDATESDIDDILDNI